MPDGTLHPLLEEAVYSERQRLKRAPSDPAHEARLTALARGIVRGGRQEWVSGGLSLVGAWADEIHGHFDRRVYGMATRILPGALNGLLAGNRQAQRGWTGASDSRVRIEGNTQLIRTLADEGTLILAPTHVSNLDSPLIGLGLYEAGLPPFIYGAGLNLFSNPIMGFWMHRLGAYTVDRLKRSQLYKMVLKDYSIRSLTTHHHSLFFPAGTRARDGAVETHIKKGLLGTGIEAWQEMLIDGRTHSEVYVVPLTLSFQLVLEANTLIGDHLAEAGKQRYIITDDEFAQPSRVMTFGRRVLDLESSVVLHFGTPLDCLGMPVSADPAERAEQTRHRRRYVLDRNGQVERDAQRDRVYTQRLADSLVAHYPKGAWAMSTHVAAYAAWACLATDLDTTDTFRIVRAPIERRQIAKHKYLERLRNVLDRVLQGASTGRWQADLPPTAEAVLDVALDRFGRYHRSRALARRGSMLVVDDPRLCLYYRNRLTYLDTPEAP
jgi:glycerol-3-phosphate O-acyltransferase